MRVLGLVPARGGSKGVPRKNVRELLGMPLLEWTTRVALESPALERVVLSTDDPEIAELGKSLGVDVPFLRPPYLADDDAPMIGVVQHALRSLEKADDYDAVCLLQPTNPLRRRDDVDGAVELLDRTHADSVISVAPVGEAHPARTKQIDAEGRLVDPPFAELVEGQRRQDLPPFYVRDGSIYLTRCDVILQQSSFKGADCRAWIVPRDRSCTIDDEFDFQLAECMLRAQS